MKGEVQILQTGLATTIQDLGRIGMAKFGVPRSGAMDQKAFFLANILLGNTINSPVLEWAMLSPKLQFSRATLIACTGALATPIINGVRQKMNCQLFVPEGALLSFDFVGKGVYGYVAIYGGFEVQNVCGSSSMYASITRDGFLKKGALISYVVKHNYKIQNASLKYNASYLDTEILEVFPGPEYEFLAAVHKTFLTNKKFKISNVRSRMGIQFSTKLAHTLPEILTGPVLPGTIQLTSSGTLIALMRDGQTTGGYPRILQLNDHSINVLAQKQTNEEVGFSLIL